MVSNLRRRLLQGALAVVVLVAAVTAGVIFLRHRSPDPLAHATFRASTIRAADGVSLAAEVTAPKGASRAPLVVMPASWGSSASVYRVLAGRLATAGYVVVAYAQRGNKDSGGKIDFAGAPTVGDVSTVITWALAHTPADPRRIGLAGVSYGGGVSLLAAARDTRVKAVVALSTWTDLAGALAQNGTLEVGALRQLLGKNGTTPGLDPQLAALGHDVTAAPATALASLTSMSTARSPSTYLAALNKRRVPIMLANGWEDSIFPPGPLVSFFDGLTGPKLLEFGKGDHTGPENSGLTGKGQNRVTDGARSWLDRYVRGDTSTAIGEPVQLQDVTSGEWHEYPSWPAPNAKATVALTDPGSARVGTAAARSTPWRAGLRTGTDTAATSGPGQFVAAADYRPPTARLARGLGSHGLSWSGDAVQVATPITGTPRLQLSVTSSARTATFFVYLYDVSVGGTGRLMSVTPFTLSGLSASRARTERLALNPVSWTVPAHHHVVLGIDSADPRYAHAEKSGSTLTFSSSTRTPVRLTIPTA